jgi:hypothetical protein
LLKIDPLIFGTEGSLTLKILKTVRLDLQHLDSLTFKLLTHAIRQSRFDIAVCIWQRYEPVCITYEKEIRQAVIIAIEESARGFHFKMFFFSKLVSFMDR